MDSPEASSIAAALEQHARSGAPAAAIADSVAAAWGRVEASLTPILGPKGVTALYRRSLLLTSRSHAWLADLAQGTSDAVDLTALTATMAKQDSHQAAQAGGQLLQTFYKLVNSLIGPSLTEKLIRFV